jgi:dihydroorotate dehydrogenase electron transfer subunit
MSDAIYRTYRIVERRPEGAVGATLILDGALAAEPGQFVMVWLPGIEERPLAVMDDDPLSMTVRVVGPFTRALAACGPGDRLWVRGPFGRGFPVKGERLLLAGGGSGVASLTLLAKRALAVGAAVRVALGARSSDQLMLPWRFAGLGCELLLATDDGSAGMAGTALDALEPALAAGWPDLVCACGPEVMLRALARRMAGGATPLYLSLERAMKCGFGVCGNCTCGDRLVCRDGPVFPVDEVLCLLEPTLG